MPQRIGEDHQGAENPVIVWLSVIAVVVIVALCVWWVMRPAIERSDFDSINLDANAVAEGGSILSEPTAVALAADIPTLDEPAQAVPDNSIDGGDDDVTEPVALEADPEPSPTTEATAEPKPDPIPDLEDSDPEIKAFFLPLSSDTDYQLLWQTSDLLPRWITVFDGAARGKVIKGVIGFKPPKGGFPVERRGANYYMSQAGYSRYDKTVATLVDIDPKALSAGFHRYRALFEQAYGQMGYDPEQMDNTIIRVLDRIISAPIFPGSIELKAASVNYTFVDADIESLPALEKQLIRMGPENTARLQTYAKTLRQALLNPN